MNNTDQLIKDLKLPQQCKECIHKDICQAHLPDSQPCLGKKEIAK